MILVSTFLLLLYFGFYGLVFRQMLKANFQYVLIYVLVCFPVYTLLLAIIYDGFESAELVKLIQYSKELLIFSALGLWIFGQKNVLKREWYISTLDYCFIAFVGLGGVFLLLGTGDATRVNQAIYFKNILLIAVFYFLGRNLQIDTASWHKLFKIVFGITILACALVTLEKIAGVHFHSLIGYAKYNLAIKDIDPAGVFGLTYTFEAQGGKPRYAAFFANPLELSASMLISLSAGLIYFLYVKYRDNKLKYLCFIVAAFICVLFAYSRASFVTIFLMLIFMAFLLRYYKILKVTLVLGIGLTVFILIFASEELKYFVIDTIRFENSSSVTHVLDWLKAIESMISNPEGIGLAMSGNAGGVERDLIVGGENQYLIYGVQMGVLGMILYILMLRIGIRNSWRAFRGSKNREEGIIPFVAASVKFGLLLPLFTANAEAYIYVALFSWWLIGYSESKYQKLVEQGNFSQKHQIVV